MARHSGMVTTLRQHGRRAFTLVEMLVVIACITVLMVLLVGAYEGVKDEANRILCANQLRRLYGALFCYAERFEGWLPDTGAASPLAGPVPDDGLHFPDTWNSRGTPYWPAERHTGNAGNLYLLIRLGILAPEDFICPATGDKPAFGPFPDTRFGFLAFKPSSLSLTDEERQFLQLRSTRHCSYSYQNMLGHPFNNPCVADPGAGRVHIDNGPRDLAILADHNPYTELQGEARPRLDPLKVPAANSLNHAGRGQNVLYLNGAIQWHATPGCGATLPDGGRDNIYRPAAGSVTDPQNIPRHVSDSYLVP